MLSSDSTKQMQVSIYAIDHPVWRLIRSVSVSVNLSCDYHILNEDRCLDTKTLLLPQHRDPLSQIFTR
jgi:hypothetical protein